MVSDRKWLDGSLYHVQRITLNKSLFVASASAPTLRGLAFLTANILHNVVFFADMILLADRQPICVLY
jgi:hypothetical protein